MKKLLFMFALLVGTISANAQLATQKSLAFDNISFGVTAGASTPLDFNDVFPLNVNAGIKLQKDFTPMFGIQLEGLAVLNDNHFSNLNTTVKATNIGLNGALNLTNIFKGYNGVPRTFEVSAIGGAGWLHTWNTSANFFTAKTGLDLALNLGKKKAASIVFTPAIYWNLNKFGDIHFNKHNAQLALNVSFIYHFKNSNGTHHFKVWDVGAMIDEISRLNGALAECESREPQVIEKIVEVPGETKVINDCDESWIVSFAFDSFKLTDEAKFILNLIGQDSIVDVVATASTDGTPGYNQKLSEKRAEAVANYLTERGVRVNSWAGKGASDKTGKTAIVTNTK